MLRVNKRFIKQLVSYQTFTPLNFPALPTGDISLRGLAVTSYILLLWFALAFLQTFFGLIDKQFLEPILIATTNPTIAFFIGLLLAAVLQLRPFVLIIILLLANNQVLSLANGVYMVLGMNIGANSTTTIMSLGHVKRKKHFKKAISTSMLQDAIYMLTALALLVVEIATKFVHKSINYWQLDMLEKGDNLPLSFIKLDYWLGAWLEMPYLLIVTILLAFFVLWVSIQRLSYYGLQINTKVVEQHLGLSVSTTSEGSMFYYGFKMGVLVPSSALLSQYLIPFVATNKIRLERAFVLLIATQIGTSLAVLFWGLLFYSPASLYLCGVHIAFNVCSIFWLLTAQWRYILTFVIRNMVKKILKNRLIGIAYVMLAFFIIPFILIFTSKDFIQVKAYRVIELTPNSLMYVDKKTNFKQGKKVYYKKIQNGVEILPQGYFLMPLHLQKNASTFQMKGQQWATSPQGYCWQSKDEWGNAIVCIDTIKTYKDKNIAYKTDSCVVFTKKYDRKARIPLLTLQIQLDVSRKMIKQYKFTDSTGRLIYAEELVSIVE